MRAELKALLDSIRVAPWADDAPRLIAADWLDENGVGENLSRGLRWCVKHSKFPKRSVIVSGCLWFDGEYYSARAHDTLPPRIFSLMNGTQTINEFGKRYFDLIDAYEDVGTAVGWVDAHTLTPVQSRL